MRYQNWDVLLFPEGSRIPVQEFKTGCHVIRDSDTADALSRSPYGGRITERDIGLLPVLTTFVTSMNAGDPFRVSIHSWRRPVASDRLKATMPEEDSIMFEARIYVDGTQVARHIFDSNTVWPVIIDRDNRFDGEGQHEPLRFPRFHQTILQQAHWDAGENFGRIKVVITEGIARSYSADLPSSGGFERFRDTLAFSFQHAPANILEYSGISWPSAEMFRQARVGFLKASQTAQPRPNHPDAYQAHSHSPRKTTQPFNSYSDGQYATLSTTIQGGPFQSYGDAWAAGKHAYSRPKWSTSGSGPPQYGSIANDDPFLVPSHAVHNTKQTYQVGLRSTSHDISMEDHVSSKSNNSRAHTDMSDVVYHPKDFEMSMNDAAIQEIIKALSPFRKEQLRRALSPEKTDMAGDNVPHNTPATEPLDEPHGGPSISGGATTESKDGFRSLSMTANAGPGESRSISAMSSKPELPRFAITRNSNSPAGNIIGRKEKMSSASKSSEDSSRGTSVDDDTIEVNARPSGFGNSKNTFDSGRRRSDSTASKRKRSSSSQHRDGNDKLSPPRRVSGQSSLQNQYCSPIRSVDVSPRSGGVPVST